MPDAIWIDRSDQLPPLARTLESHASIGLDTEFLRERTFFPKLCLLQLTAGSDVWCVDTLRCGSLECLGTALTTAPSRKVIHSARQDLEAFYLNERRVISPVFDTQIAAGCIGLKPQIGYAELVKTLLDVTVPKGQTRTDWSKRPLTRAQLEYAADDVLYLQEIAERLTERLRSTTRDSTSPTPSRRGRDCAACSSCRRRRARAPRSSRYGAKGRRASAICRADGSFPMPRSSSSRRSIRFARPPPLCARCRSP
jgi:ribonuclease D